MGRGDVGFIFAFLSWESDQFCRNRIFGSIEIEFTEIREQKLVFYIFSIFVRQRRVQILILNYQLFSTFCFQTEISIFFIIKVDFCHAFNKFQIFHLKVYLGEVNYSPSTIHWIFWLVHFFGMSSKKRTKELEMIWSWKNGLEGELGPFNLWKIVYIHLYFQSSVG